MSRAGPPMPYRGVRVPLKNRAKILATVGPACASPAALAKLLKAGADAFRLNCSHASIAELEADVAMIREASRRVRIPAAIVLDLQGPRLRVGRLAGGGPMQLERGASVTLTTRPVEGAGSVIPTDFRGLPKAVSAGSRILIDEGALELSVVRVRGTEVSCRVVAGGLLKPRKGINIPGADVGLPALTAEDRQDLAAGLRLGVDYVALSFVKTAADLAAARRALARRGSAALLIAKIETPEAVENIGPIIVAADGIMVARGDLAVELSPAEVPVVQKRLVRLANEAGRLVIVATQMLESMTRGRLPTRAEASDVANAVFDGADAVMLSGETAAGEHPASAVAMMSDIVARAEASEFAPRPLPRPAASGPEDFSHALARAAASASELARPRAIVAFTMTGRSGRVLSKYRPPVPVYALTPDRRVQAQLCLQWGVVPFHCPMAASTDALIASGERLLLSSGALRRGDTVIVTAGGPARRKSANLLKLYTLGI